MKKITIPTALLSILLFSSCRKKNNKIKISPIKEPKTITVWIHGSRVLPEFHPQELFYAPKGLNAITDVDKNLFKYKYAKTLSQKNPERFQKADFYAYGWSGKINFTERENVARDLYENLQNLIQKYKDVDGISPKLRIITHSHGGNVALNLATVKDSNDTSFLVDELILLACPVQERTKDLIKDLTFKRVYSFFSSGDIIQCIDPQRLHKENRHDKKCPLFSKRRFPAHAKLSQAKVRSHGRGIMHIEYLFLKFVSKLPQFLDALDKDFAKRDKTYNPEKIKYDFLAVDLHTKKAPKRYKENR